MSNIRASKQAGIFCYLFYIEAPILLGPCAAGSSVLDTLWQPKNWTAVMHCVIAEAPTGSIDVSILAMRAGRRSGDRIMGCFGGRIGSKSGMERVDPTKITHSKYYASFSAHHLALPGLVPADTDLRRPIGRQSLRGKIYFYLPSIGCPPP